MKFDLVRPCPTCPFRVDIRFDLHPERRAEIVQGLRSDESFTCHSTIDYGAWVDEFVPNEKNQHCAGALIAMKKDGSLFANRIPRMAAIFGWFDPDKLDMAQPVVDSLGEWL